MSTPLLYHGPDDVIAYALVVRGMGTAPTWWFTHKVEDLTVGDTSHDWPVRTGGMADSPDECISVFETTPIVQAGIQVTGESQRRYGATIRIRGADKPSARMKAEQILFDLHERLYAQRLDIPATTRQPVAASYLLQSVRATLVPAGRDNSSSQRWLVNLNCLATIQAYPITG